MHRHLAQALLQSLDAVEFELRITPLKHFNGLEFMIFEFVDQLLIEGLDIGGYAEGAVVQVASRAAGDLREFGGREVAMGAAVELARARERDVIDIQVEAHADGVGRDEEIDVAGLVERHLRVAGARAQSAEHHRGAAALPSDQLRDGVDVVRRERHDGGARLQARDFLLARISELREPRPRDEIRARDQLADRVRHRLRAEQQGFAHSSRVE